MKTPTNNRAEDLHQLTLRAMNGEKLSNYELQQAHLYSMMKVAWWSDVRDFLEGKESHEMGKLKGVFELSSILSELSPEQIQLVCEYAKDVRDEGYSSLDIDLSNLELDVQEENPLSELNLSIDPDALLSHDDLEKL